jgi:hypothetical protein
LIDFLKQKQRNAAMEAESTDRDAQEGIQDNLRYQVGHPDTIRAIAADEYNLIKRDSREILKDVLFFACDDTNLNDPKRFGRLIGRFAILQVKLSVKQRPQREEFFVPHGYY